MEITKMKARRLELRMTQVDLAFHSRVAPGDISKFENRMARPYPSQAERLGNVLGIPAEQLIDAVQPAEAVAS